MSGLNIGFIGGGRIVRIILGGWEETGILPLLSITVSDPSEVSLRRLKTRFPHVHALPGGNMEAAWGDIVFLALPPPVAGEVITAIRPNIRDDAIVVSLMPKISIAQLSAWLGGFRRIVRMIPSAPAVIGRGYNPVAFSPELPGTERGPLVPLFASLGDCPEVPEEDLETYAVITAMGPTYLWFQMDELVQIARGFGLSEQAARTAVGTMIEGATRVMFAAGMDPGEVMDQVPVKPLGEDEQSIRELYRKRLIALHVQLKG